MIRRFTSSPKIEGIKQMAAIDKTDLTQSILGLQFWVIFSYRQHTTMKNATNMKYVSQAKLPDFIMITYLILIGSVLQPYVYRSHQ